MSRSSGDTGPAEGPSGVTGLPLGLFRETLLALLDVRIEPCVIGTLSLLEHLPSDAWWDLQTEDVDLLLALEHAEQVSQVEEAMSGLGLSRPRGRSGKWLPDENSRAAVDLIGRTLPTGLAEPACFPEAFANVVYLDRRDCRVLPNLINLPSNATVKVAGPLVTVLGKSLKVSRYLTLPDWTENQYRRERAARASRDILLVFGYNSSCFDAEVVAEIALAASGAGQEVRRSLERGVRAFSDLFGFPDGAGWDLARHSGRFDVDFSSLVQQAATRMLGEAQSGG